MEFRVLGPVRAVQDGVEVTLGGPRQRRLLAVLLLGEGRVVAVDHIVTAVWGEEEPPAGAWRTVLSYISRLRSAVGSDYVATRSDGYLMSCQNTDVDAYRFEHSLRSAKLAPPRQALSLLDEALALWDGRPFGDLADEHWCRPAAIRLEELRLVALESRAQALLDLGAHADSVPELEQLVVEHPYRDSFRGQLMLALFRSGRQAEALRSFQEHRRLLAEETGLDPSRDLVSLERRIAIADASLQFVTAGRTTRGYVLAETIGESAFATVYRAVQPSLEREVALTVVRPELADDAQYIRRFESEARRVGRLEHPHVVPLYDFWREPGAAYLVFRYVRGGTLKEARLANGHWPLARVAGLIEEIGTALTAAHDAGIVHGDVSPANVLFDDAGNSYLADFGIATDCVPSSALPALRTAGSWCTPVRNWCSKASQRRDRISTRSPWWRGSSSPVPRGSTTPDSPPHHTPCSSARCRRCEIVGPTCQPILTLCCVGLPHAGPTIVTHRSPSSLSPGATPSRCRPARWRRTAVNPSIGLGSSLRWPTRRWPSSIRTRA